MGVKLGKSEKSSQAGVGFVRVLSSFCRVVGVL